MSAEWHQQGAASSPHSSDAYLAFDEPPREREEDELAARPTGQPEDDLCGLPPWIVRLWFRIRNSISVYNFFTIYCVNASLNIEIYREYMTSHGTSISSLYQRSWIENMYILTLAAPFFDVVARLFARNYYKLQLARAQSHTSLAASFAVCTPSLNAYALLLLRRNRRMLALVLTLDALEIAYSIYMWTMQPRTTGTLWTKLVLLIITTSMLVWDLVVLVQKRQYFNKDLPRHVHPIFVCWDTNRRFHWSSANSVFDLLDRHESHDPATFETDEAIDARRAIVAFNFDEEAVADDQPSPNIHTADATRAKSGSVNVQEHYQLDEDRRRLLAERR